jgi:hypothetical protein
MPHAPDRPIAGRGMIAARVAPGVRLSWLGRTRLGGDPASGALMEGDHRGLRFAETPPPSRAESGQRSRRNTAFGATGPCRRVGKRPLVADTTPRFPRSGGGRPVPAGRAAAGRPQDDRGGRATLGAARASSGQRLPRRDDAAPLRDGRIRAYQAHDLLRAVPAAARLSPTREEGFWRAS